MTAARRRSSLIRTLTGQLLLLGGAVIGLQFIIVIVDYALEDEAMSILMAQHEAASAANLPAIRDNRAAALMSDPAEERSRIFTRDYAFRVLDSNGRILAEHNGLLFPGGPTAPARPSAHEQATFGILTRVAVESFPGADGPVSIAVAVRRDPAGVFRWVFLREVLEDVAQPMFPLLLLSLLVSIFTVRRGLRPLADAAKSAAALTPTASSLRIADDRLPAEVADMVQAINDALDRVHRAFESQREFLAIAAHELRTPLAVLMLQLGKLSGPDAAQLRIDVEQMSRLVNQLLLVARLEGRAPTAMASVQLATIARAVTERILPLAVERGRSIALDDRGAPPVLGNADMLSDALRNLIDNALAHAPAGTGVTVTCGPGRVLHVEDQGPGVPAAERQRIFERFHRDAGSMGSGLGLFIVRRIAEVHGARVSVTDATAGGACFTLEFPAPPPEPAPPAMPANNFRAQD